MTRGELDSVLRAFGLESADDTARLLFVDRSTVYRWKSGDGALELAGFERALLELMLEKIKARKVRLDLGARVRNRGPMYALAAFLRWSKIEQ